MFVRSFADSDGDGIGDLRGLTAHLDALNDGDPSTTTDLGISGIWLMPIAASPSYHGYDVSDERAVEPDYGTIDDLKAFVAAAHERGIAVISDLVLNHTSDQNPWFVDSLAGTGHRDWYIWSGTDPGYGGPDGQQVWHPGGTRFYYGQFGPGLPDLNLRNPDVTAELEDVARFWVEEVGFDGFRLDAIKHLIEDGTTQVNTPETHAWLQAFRTALHETAPNALLVGEVYDLSVAVARYVPEDVDLAFDFDRAQATVDAIRRDDAGPLTSALAEDATLFGPDETAGFLTNHDQERIASQLREDPASLRLAAGLLLTGGGTPFVYYGEEIGLTGEKPDEKIRTPLPWTAGGPAAGFSTATPWEPLEPGSETRNVATESADPASLLSAYRDLIRLRSTRPSLAGGATVPLTTADSAVVAWARVAVGDRTVVIANVTDRPATSPALDLDVGPFCVGGARVLYQTGAADPGALAATVPAIDARGGFHGWTPLPVLPPRSVTIIELGG
ncbi:MAG TPA: alpha-amylase family glycosyl hydrolase [Candidatus Deferrimicrobium sp.]|nr:alpha-amylase family glycosyl hydrolase [Candidatus Deferrimicrobium sp.]